MYHCISFRVLTIAYHGPPARHCPCRGFCNDLLSLSLSLSPPYLSPRTGGLVCTQRQERQQQQKQKQTALYMVPVSISNHGNFTPTLTAWRYLHRGRTVVQMFEISLVAKFCATCAYHIQCSCSPSLRLIFTRGQHSHVKEAVSTRSGYGAMPCCSV